MVGTMHGTDLRVIFDFLNGAELGRCRCVELQWRRISSALGNERANVPPLLNIDCGDCTFLDLQLKKKANPDPAAGGWHAPNPGRRIRTAGLGKTMKMEST